MLPELENGGAEMLRVRVRRKEKGGTCVAELAHGRGAAAAQAKEEATLGERRERRMRRKKEAVHRGKKRRKRKKRERRGGGKEEEGQLCLFAAYLKAS